MNKVIFSIAFLFVISFSNAQTTSAGSYLVSGNQTGYIFSTQTDGTNGWGYWYGLYYGKSGFNLFSGEPANNFANPIILQSFYGIGLRTSGGKVTLGKNGAMTVGITTDSEIQTIHNLANPTYKLYVGGGTRTEEVKVDLKSAWPDYVFDSNYKLPTLREIETFVYENKHLPNMPSAAALKAEDGLELGSIVTKQQEKIEELYLLMINLEKKVVTLIEENEKLKQSSSIILKK